MTTATSITTGALYMALELGCDKWVLASATQAAEKPRFRTVPARDLAKFQEEIAKPTARVGRPTAAPWPATSPNRQGQGAFRPADRRAGVHLLRSGTRW